MWFCEIALVIGLLGIVGFVHATGESDLMKRLKTKLNFEPQAMLDIGANEGQTSISARKIWPKTSILMLEASSRHAQTLTSVTQSIGNAEFRIGVMSSQNDQEVDFWDGPSTTGNSMFREQTRYFSNVKPQKQRTTTLDLVVAESKLLADKMIDFIKVDVQGAELLVLAGGKRTLSQTSYIQLEASTIVYNQGSPCFWEVDAFLRSQGFALYDIGETIYHPRLFRTRGVGQYEVLYINPNSPRLPPKHNRNAQFCFHSNSSSGAMVQSDSSLGASQSEVIAFEIYLNGLLSGIAVASAAYWLIRQVGTKRHVC